MQLEGISMLQAGIHVRHPALQSHRATFGTQLRQDALNRLYGPGPAGGECQDRGPKKKILFQLIWHASSLCLKIQHHCDNQ